MRSLHVYRALDQVSNRFTLCQTISKDVRLKHQSGNSVESSVTSALLGVGVTTFNDVVNAVALPLLPQSFPAVIFHAGDLL